MTSKLAPSVCLATYSATVSVRKSIAVRVIAVFTQDHRFQMYHLRMLPIACMVGASPQLMSDLMPSAVYPVIAVTSWGLIERM